MRSLLVGCAVLLVASATGGQAAAQAVRPVRVAQVISMSGVASPLMPPEAAEEQHEAGSKADTSVAPGTGKLDAAFRVHDLSRRWVEFEMKSSFLSSTGTAMAPTIDDDPFAHVGIARFEADPRAAAVPLAPPISVPGWMRGGLAFAAAASSYRSGCGTSAYRPAGFLSAAAENRRFGYYGLMSGIACEYGIPTGLFDAMIIRESGYQPSIYSPKNAFGLTQLMADTAEGLGVNRYDIEQNLRGGAKYLRQQLDRFGQVHLALAAYNAGPGRVRNGVLPRIAETQAYVDNVLLNWQRLAGLETTVAGQSIAVRPPAGWRAKTGRSATVSMF
ncbi:Membrane-bound lytic murein transglycosylase F [compost metagenome]|jgi:hypothetical protein